jgi:hypothetical protein
MALIGGLLMGTFYHIAEYKNYLLSYLLFLLHASIMCNSIFGRVEMLFFKICLQVFNYTSGADPKTHPNLIPSIKPTRLDLF